MSLFQKLLLGNIRQFANHGGTVAAPAGPGDAGVSRQQRSQEQAGKHEAGTVQHASR